MTETHKAIALALIVFSLAAIRILTRRAELRSLGSGYLDATRERKRWKATMKRRPEMTQPWTVRVGEAVMQRVAAMRLGER